ncbi:transposase [Actinomadura opuntiae]|uniref:transposase n=1 Tax=Actinomadura sp. OS1-43 TaxID=604315 RepID=UPI0033411417
MVWNNLDIHHSAAIRAFIDAHTGWLTVLYLPAYAPDLNPTVNVWSRAETLHGQLPGYCPGPPHQHDQAPTQSHPAPPRGDRRLPNNHRPHP